MFLQQERDILPNSHYSVFHYHRLTGYRMMAFFRPALEKAGRPEDPRSITSRDFIHPHVIDIICNINLLRYGDFGDIGAIDMALTR